MAQRSNTTPQGSNKPSKLLALIALAIALALPFVLVKTFPHKIKPPVLNKTTSANESEEQDEEDYADAEDEVTPDKQDNTIEESTTDLARTANPSSNKKTTDKAAEVKPALIKNESNNTHPDWVSIKVKHGDSLASVFNRAGLTAQTLQTIIHDNPHNAAFAHIKPDQEIRFQIKKSILEQMILPSTTSESLVVLRDGKHYKIKTNAKKTSTHNHFVSAVINGSLYGTAKRYNIPFKLIKQMTDIFTWDINFAKDVRAGDQFTIVYSAHYIGDKLVGTGDIIAVSYRNKGKTFQAVRHTNRQGESDYYSPEGVSLKKAFNRYPVRFSHISSGFSLSRYHPILHYRRAHKGVDLAAPIGTPIFATGSGRIEMIGRQNGYGNMIKIRHDKTFSSVYGHLLKFQKGLSRGDYVRRGQIIGYVGQSGLASGPHCHYELHINNFPRNPTTVDLPRGLAISPREMASFKANSRTLLAQLKLYENTHLASAAKNKARG